MKLLRLRGENLASLGRPFALDFATGALQGAGLFAITGETGSGKSTLLDAMCLALYGSYPRVDFSSAESVADPGGEEVGSNDARNILRRGVGLGWAEMDFEARDGKEYQTRWEARRAHGKGSGKLQAAKRSVRRLGDGVVLAEKTTEVGKLVVELTGLNFEQFQRTCLLAQGKFDAFLTAKENERAELLERITGTGIYSKISQAVFARAAERKAEWEKLLSAWAALQAMSPEERAGVERQLLEAGERARRAEAKIAELDGQLGLWAALARAEDEELLARGKKDAAEAAWVEEEGARKKLAAWEKAQELAEVFRARKNAVAADDGARAALRKAEENFDKAILEEAKAKDTLNQVERDWSIAAKAVQDFAEDWRRAGLLDGSIASADAELVKLREDAKRNGTSHAAVVGKLDRLQKERGDGERQLRTVGEWLREHAGRVELAGQYGLVRGLLDLRQRLQTGRKAPVTARLSEIAGQLGEVERQVGGTHEAELHRRAGLAPVAVALAEAEKLERRCVELAADRVAAEDGLRASEEAFAGAVKAIALAQGRWEEVAKLSERADLSATERAEELRGRLEEGVECPVCGSTEHPYAKHEGAWGELARELRRRKSEMEGELAALGKQRDAALQSKTKAQQQIETAGRLMVEAEATLGGVRLKIPAEFVGMDAQELEKQAQEASRQLQELSKLREKQAQLLGWKSELEKLGENAMQIAKFLEGFGLSVAVLDGAHEKAIAELKRRVDEVVEKGQEEKKLGERLAGMAVEEGQARTSVEEGGKVLREMEEAVSAKEIMLRGLREGRAGLLGGEVLNSHERRHRDAEERARQEREGALAALAGKGAARAAAQVSLDACREAARVAGEELGKRHGEFTAGCARLGFGEGEVEGLLGIGAAAIGGERERLQKAEQSLHALAVSLQEKAEGVKKAREACAGLAAGMDLEALRQAQVELRNEAQSEIGGARAKLGADDLVLAAAMEARGKVDEAEAKYKVWQEMNEAIGSAQGDKFRRFVQSVTLEHLVQLANHHIQGFAPRYRLGRAGVAEQLGLQVVDREMGDAVRPTATLSGGERFLTSLGLALALSGLEGKESFVDTLFIDEGFGTLDAESLELVMSILHQLPSMGRRVGVISHVAAMREQIAVQVRVVKRGAGRSEVEVWDGGTRVGMG